MTSLTVVNQSVVVGRSISSGTGCMPSRLLGQPQPESGYVCRMRLQGTKVCKKY